MLPVYSIACKHESMPVRTKTTYVHFLPLHRAAHMFTRVYKGESSFRYYVFDVLPLGSFRTKCPP